MVEPFEPRPWFNLSGFSAPKGSCLNFRSLNLHFTERSCFCFIALNDQELNMPLNLHIDHDLERSKQNLQMQLLEFNSTFK